MRSAFALIVIFALSSFAAPGEAPPSVEQVLAGFRASRSAAPEARITYTRSMVVESLGVEVREYDKGTLLLKQSGFALHAMRTDAAGNRAGTDAIWISNGDILASLDKGGALADRAYDTASSHDAPKAHLASSDCILNVWLYRRGFPIYEFLDGASNRDNIQITTSYNYSFPRDHIITLQIRVRNRAGQLGTLGEMDIDPQRGMLVESQRTYQVVDGKPQQPPFTEVKVKKAERLGNTDVWFPTVVEMRADKAQIVFLVSGIQAGAGEFQKGLPELLAHPVVIRDLDGKKLYLLERSGKLIQRGSSADDEAAQRLLDDYLKSISD